jgi:hypothetical protein
MLPLTAVALIVWQRRFPGLLIVAAVSGLVWSGYHTVNRYRAARSENTQPACQLGQRLGAPAMSNDLVGLDCAGRNEWLGKPELPLLTDRVTPESWESFHRRFPQVQFALHNPNIRDAARPPESWPPIECLPGLNPDEKPVCAYHIPAN